MKLIEYLYEQFGDLVDEFLSIDVSGVVWSENAENIRERLYQRGDESTNYDTCDRIAKEWAEQGAVHGYWSHGDIYVMNKILTNILVSQLAAPNSPQWFNTGVPNKDLLWGYDSGRSITQKFNLPQVHACFINGVEDSLESMSNLWDTETLVFKRGSGSGTNVSAIREKGAPLSNGGSSSGVMSFLKTGDVNAGAIKSGGTTRRAALMRTMDIDHPDIVDFIRWKAVEEEKVKYLVEGRKVVGDSPYATDMQYDWTGEAYGTVDGQNSNNSVMVTDEFMRAVQNDSDWTLKSRVPNGTDKVVRARDVWDEIVNAAWRSADPALQYYDTINRHNPVANDEHIHATNPCSEYVFLDNTACNLASINLAQVYRLSDGLDSNTEYLLEFVASVMTAVLDLSVTIAGYPTREFARKTKEYRTLGLGFTALGEYLALNFIGYDSDRGLDEASHIMRRIRNSAIDVSVHLAKNLGPCPAWERNKKHFERLYGTAEPMRNSQLTAIAPAGTISFVMDAGSTGIEPVYSFRTLKTLSDGGTMTIVAGFVKEAVKAFGVNEGHKENLEFYNKVMSDDPDAFNHIPKDYHWVVDAHMVSPQGHLNMVSRVQKYVCGAISKTINMPNDSTPEDISTIYMNAWALGVKAISIYRDGCKASQPMNANGKFTSVESSERIVCRRELPSKRLGYTKKVVINGKSIYIRTGEYEDGSLGEVFIDVSGEGGAYGSMLSAMAKMLSIGLQYGVPVEEFASSFMGTVMEPRGLVQGHETIKTTSSILDLLARDLILEYVETSHEDSLVFERKGIDICLECGSTNIQKTGTCSTCVDCGTTTGC